MSDAPNPRTEVVAKMLSAQQRVGWTACTDAQRVWFLQRADVVLAAADAASAPLLERVTQSLRQLLDRFEIDEADGDHRVRLFDRGSFAIAVNDAKIALAEVDALEAHE